MTTTHNAELTPRDDSAEPSAVMLAAENGPWVRLQRTSDYIEAEEGAEVAAAWVKASLLHRVLPVLSLRIAARRAAAGSAPRDVAIGWLALNAMARKRLADASAPVSGNQAIDVAARRNVAILTAVVEEAEKELHGVPGDAVREGMYQIGFRRQFDAAQREASTAQVKRRNPKRGRKNDKSYEASWRRRTGHPSAAAHLRNEVVPTALDLLGKVRSADLPAPARAALDEWETDLRHAL